MQEILSWGTPQTIQMLLTATISHHGRPILPPLSPSTQFDWNSPDRSQYDWRLETKKIDKLMHRWFPKSFAHCSETLPNNPQFYHLLSGLISLADWIGSDTRFFQFEDSILPDYNTIAREKSYKSLVTIRLDTSDISAILAPSFLRVDWISPSKFNTDCARNVDTEAKMVILEAETGSGKTEAALWRFTQLLAAGKISGLYFAVPPCRSATTATSNRCYIASSLCKTGTRSTRSTLGNSGMLVSGKIEGQSLPGWRVEWDDEEDGDSTFPRWAAEHSTRFLAAPVAVGTVDQAMLAALCVKHAHLRGAALSRSLLVIDEVHASDTYMTAVLKRLLDDHLAIGGYAMLMSATLGARARVNWSESPLPDFESASATPYPAIWVDGKLSSSPIEPSGRTRVVYPNAVPTMDPIETAERAIHAARQGGRVLVIRNTVSKAIATWRAVRKAKAEDYLVQVADGPALPSWSILCGGSHLFGQGS